MFVNYLSELVFVEHLTITIRFENYTCLENCLENYIITFINVVDKHPPIRNKRIGSSKTPWITAQLKHKMRERDVL
jgi:hypothetical protein